jgi:hypothetical protein
MFSLLGNGNTAWRVDSPTVASNMPYVSQFLNKNYPSMLHS